MTINNQLRMFEQPVGYAASLVIPVEPRATLDERIRAAESACVVALVEQHRGDPEEMICGKARHRDPRNLIIDAVMYKE